MKLFNKLISFYNKFNKNNNKNFSNKIIKPDLIKTGLFYYFYEVSLETLLLFSKT